MRIPTAADIVVIGGGPAGSMAAAMLSKKGYDVVLLEKEKHPRIKVGESLIPHFWKYCDLMGVTDEVEAAGFVRKNGGWILWEDELKGVSFSDYGFDRPGLHVERDILDNIFLKKSAELGTQVFEETMALKIEKVQGFWQTTYKAIGADEKGLITSKIVIDASGQSALTARQLGFRKFDEGFKFHSFWGYFEGGSYFSNELSIEPFGNQKVVPPATFISSLGNWGWSWQIPLQHKTSVGVVIPREDMSEFSSLGETLEERLINKVRKIPVLGNLMEGAKYTEGSTGGIKDYSYLPEKVAFENCFLIGDAAAFVDPINSAGVPIGMFAGYLASWAVDGILKNPGREDYYHKHFSYQYLSRLHLFRLIAFPSDQTDEAAKLAAKKALSLSSKTELGLVLAQTATINRISNVEETIKSLGLGKIDWPIRKASEEQLEVFNQLFPV